MVLNYNNKSNFLYLLGLSPACTILLSFTLYIILFPIQSLALKRNKKSP
jgi:hypothetical protein